jgi:hypothetical protein
MVLFHDNFLALIQSHWLLVQLMQFFYFVIDLHLMVMLYLYFLIKQYFVVQLLMLIVLIQLYQHQFYLIVYIVVVQVDQNIQDEQEH